jgi:hypothetical protein
LSSRFLPSNIKIKRYKTIVLGIVSYGCETWSLTLREDHRSRVFDNRALRRIFGPKMEDVAGGWRRLHNEELRNLYASSNIMRVIKWNEMGGTCTTHTEFWLENLKGNDLSEDLVVDGRR